LTSHKNLLVVIPFLSTQASQHNHEDFGNFNWLWQSPVAGHHVQRQRTNRLRIPVVPRKAVAEVSRRGKL